MAKYTTPSGTVSALYANIREQKHVLIAGTSGAGKSVATRGVLNSLLYRPFSNMEGAVELILIDPKGTELRSYKPAPHCIKYASAAEPGAMLEAVRFASAVVDSRFCEMEKNPAMMDSQHYYKGSDIWLVIDELADLMLSADAAEVKKLLQHIGQLGRAARVHMLACTQCPIVKVIPTEIKVNFDAIMALRTRSAQDSRNIIGMSGAENFPKVGKGMYYNPDFTETVTVDIPYVDDTETQELVTWWTRQVHENAQNAEISPSATSGNETPTKKRKGPFSWFKTMTVLLLAVDVIARIM